MMNQPPCPITGAPPTRLVQWVSARLLADLWRYGLGVDAGPSFRGVDRFGLWESPTGLYFFDPMLEGDTAFYKSLYGRLKFESFPREGRPRSEFELAAKHVRSGDQVLDVGCGLGTFRHSIPHARYVGLDPNFCGEPGSDWARVEGLDAHVLQDAESYDVVTAFEVLEHVSNPVAMLADMAQAARPGGRVIVGVPHVPSAGTRIPNYLLNAVPHHLTWWTEPALRTIAARIGLTNVTVEVSPWNAGDAVIYWIERCSPIRCRDIHFRHRWTWHASVLMGIAGGLLMSKLRPDPGNPEDEGASLLMIAEKHGPIRA